ncbi:SCP2 sterol-binding domain-containing protein [Marinobacteraceae bacterium S3BR75-40.1]
MTAHPRALFQQLSARLPSPAPALERLDGWTPFGVRQLLVETPLNRLFAGAIADGTLEPLYGRRIRLELADSDWGITIGYWEDRLRYLEGPGEVTIRGTGAAFRSLLEREEDPDQLFFRRELIILGDTELGLMVKNILDATEWDLRELMPAPLRR